jgi:ABC-2 type transport system permease protein
VRWRRLWALARKEALHLLRDPRSLGIALLIPLLQLLLFGYALTLDVDRVPLLVWDRSQTPASRDLISRFDGSRYFSLQDMAFSYAELEEAIDSGRALAALVIPAELGGDIEAGRPTAVQLIVDGSDSNTATLALGYAEALTQSYSDRILRQKIRRLGYFFPRPVLDLRSRAWYNPELRSRNFIVPGLIVVIMNVIAALLTSLTVAREWENGTMEQLISTPVKGPELIMGKLLPYFGLGMFDLLLAVILGRYLFEVPLRGSAALVFALAAVFLVGVLSVGMLLSVLTRSQLLSSQAAMIVTYLPALLLSGLVFPLANMPPALQVISHFFPARYFVRLMRAIYLKGLGLEFFALEASLLLLFAAVVLALANLAFKKRLS